MERTANLMPRLLLTLPHHHPEPQAKKSNLLDLGSGSVTCIHRAPAAHRCLICPPPPSRQVTTYQPTRAQACNPPLSVCTHTQPIPSEDSTEYGNRVHDYMYLHVRARARVSGKTNSSLPATRLTPTWLGHPLLWK